MADSTFLFWNLNGKPLQASVGRLVRRHAVDVVLLAECAIPEVEMLQGLDPGRAGDFRLAGAVASRGIEVYSRFDPACFGSVLRESDHYLIRPFTAPGGLPILLVVAHLASPLYKKPLDMHSRCVGLAEAIRWAEEASGHRRTVVVGDLNVNPFHSGMLDVRGLNALWDRETVKRKDPRRFGAHPAEEFRMFYNPMWGHLGDATKPSGTYYYDESNPEVDTLWNIFDQILVRRDLIDRLRKKDPKILTTDGRFRLTTADGRPDARACSDHLPLLFRLDLGTRGLP